jgi:hypothetical protein
MFSIVSGNFLYDAWINKSVGQYFVVSRHKADPEERQFPGLEKARPKFTKPIMMQIAALIFITILLMIRSIYRTIEVWFSLLPPNWCSRLIAIPLLAHQWMGWIHYHDRALFQLAGWRGHRGGHVHFEHLSPQLAPV